jgi:hypothetical protein
LYGLSGSFSFDNYLNKDILDFYAPDTTTLPEGSTFMGSSLRFRYHMNEWFYAGLGWDWMAKAFEIKSMSDTVMYSWYGWNPHASLGLVFFRGANSFLSLEASAGRVLLHDSSLSQTGLSNTQATFTGAATTGSIGVGGTWFLIPLLGAEIYGGYRMAKLDSSSLDARTNDGAPINNVRAEKPFIDFSGPVVRLGLALYLGMPDPFADLGALAPAAPQSASPTAQPSPVSPTAAP